MIFLKKKKKKRKIDKSPNLFKFVSVLLSALVKRVGVSRMQDLKINKTLTSSVHNENGFHLWDFHFVTSVFKFSSPSKGFFYLFVLFHLLSFFSMQLAEH